MARRLRKDLGDMIYHVINRGVGKRRLFFDEGDFAAFEKVLGEACERQPMRVIGYCLRCNHFPLNPLAEEGWRASAVHAMADGDAHPALAHVNYCGRAKYDDLLRLPVTAAMAGRASL